MVREWTTRVDHVPLQDQYKDALQGDTDLSMITTNSEEGKVSFDLVCNAKNWDFHVKLNSQLPF